MSQAPALALSNITVTFVADDAGGMAYTAVSYTTLTVGAGEFVSVVGPTGCGKSTLLNIAALAPRIGADSRSLPLSSRGR
jgi:NitT/TauT family transport system ATP-binding protein